MRFASLIALGFSTAYGQRFEVASIKPSPPLVSPRIRVDMDGGPGTGDPTTFSCRNCSLSLLMMQAYDVKYYQVAGLDSRSGEMYEIAARVPPGTTKEQFRVMLQNLLADRFQMKLHRDTKQMKAFDLVVAKNGPKMKNSADKALEAAPTVSSAAASEKPLDRDGFPILPPGQGGMASIRGRARMQGVSETMEALAARLSNQLDLPVVDSTGLKGKYDFSFYWAADQPSGGTDDSGPNMFSALESQLGLKLKPKKAPVTIILIDHLNIAPSEN